MAYHEAFWVTLGTVAPVVGLVHAVNIGRFGQLPERLIAQREQQVLELERRANDAMAEDRNVIEALTQAVQARDQVTIDRLQLERQQAANHLEQVRRDLADLTASKIQTRMTVRLAPWARRLASTSWILCSVAITWSLVSLADEVDFLWPELALYTIVIPLLVLTATTALPPFWSWWDQDAA